MKNFRFLTQNEKTQIFEASCAATFQEALLPYTYGELFLYEVLMIEEDRKYISYVLSDSPKSKIIDDINKTLDTSYTACLKATRKA
jgi:hypothetical protein